MYSTKERYNIITITIIAIVIIIIITMYQYHYYYYFWHIIHPKLTQQTPKRAIRGGHPIKSKERMSPQIIYALVHSET